MKNLKNLLLGLLAVSAFAACSEDIEFTERDGRQYPEAIVGSAPVAFLRAKDASGDRVEVILTKENGFTTKEIYATSSSPADYDQAISLSVGDEALVAEYSATMGVDYKLLPAPFYRIIEGNTLNIHSGAMESAAKELKLLTVNPLGNVLEPGRYLLPLVGTSPWQDKPVGTLYVDVTIREPYTDPDGVELYTGEDMFTVFYLNTAQFDPRLANDIILINMKDSGYARGLGNIVNLRSISVDFDSSTGRVSCLPKPDMRYVLNHYSEMILPVQETGRKVCLCIDGGGQGVGFCNFTDGQISQFVTSVKNLVDDYHLDGVNLWDRNSGYGKEGAPAVNTTSYPKLIVALREALGPHRLLTLTDYEEPTEYFYDTTATGGIEVGKYIDYAWSGYFDYDGVAQVVDPWHQGFQMVSSAFPRKPIAGLSSHRYGCINVPQYMFTEELYSNLITWCNYIPNRNCIFVFYDVRSIIQDRYEGSDQFQNFFNSWFDTYTYMADIRRLSNPIGDTQYNKWKKNW